MRNRVHDNGFGTLVNVSLQTRGPTQFDVILEAEGASGFCGNHLYRASQGLELFRSHLWVADYSHVCSHSQTEDIEEILVWLREMP